MNYQTDKWEHLIGSSSQPRQLHCELGQCVALSEQRARISSQSVVANVNYLDNREIYIRPTPPPPENAILVLLGWLGSLIGILCVVPVAVVALLIVMRAHFRHSEQVSRRKEMKSEWDKGRSLRSIMAAPAWMRNPLRSHGSTKSSEEDSVIGFSSSSSSSSYSYSYSPPSSRWSSGATPSNSESYENQHVEDAFAVSFQR